MTNRERERYRAAALCAVKAFFDSLEQSANETPRIVRRPPPAENDGYNEVAAREADRILKEQGIRR